jgi:hypothetical protein
MLPEAVRPLITSHLDSVRRQHQIDLAAGFGSVTLPDALERKFPNAPTDWAWPFVFPAGRICRDERFGPPTRFHLHESVIDEQPNRHPVGAADIVGTCQMSFVAPRVSADPLGCRIRRTHE